jgi:hypothetical protein
MIKCCESSTKDQKCSFELRLERCDTTMTEPGKDDNNEHGMHMQAIRKGEDTARVLKQYSHLQRRFCSLFPSDLSRQKT